MLVHILVLILYSGFGQVIVRGQLKAVQTLKMIQPCFFPFKPL